MAPVKIDISFCQNRGYLKGFQIIPSSQSTSIIVPLLAFRETSIRRDPIFIFGAANSSVKKPGDGRTTPDWLSLTSGLYWKRATILQFYLALPDRG